MTIVLPAEIRAMIAQGALFVVNHSGGKDSQALYAVVKKFVPRRQILIIHADLGDVEWEVQSHIRESIDPALPFIVCRNERRSLLQMVADRGLFPSPANRQCTSDLKRGPIEREIRRYLKANPQFGGKIVNCLGLRAEESSDRAKKPEVRTNKANSVAGRTWLEWLPIHTLLLDDVLAVIEADGQTLHWAYDAGMSRLSCCFCIMASKKDLTTAAILKPRLYAEYVALERELGVSMLMPAKGKPQFLEDVTGIKAQPIRSSYLLPKRAPKAAA